MAVAIEQEDERVHDECHEQWMRITQNTGKAMAMRVIDTWNTVLNNPPRNVELMKEWLKSLLDSPSFSKEALVELAQEYQRSNALSPVLGTVVNDRCWIDLVARPTDDISGDLYLHKVVCDVVVVWEFNDLHDRKRFANFSHKQFIPLYRRRALGKRETDGVIHCWDITSFTKTDDEGNVSMPNTRTSECLRHGCIDWTVLGYEQTATSGQTEISGASGGTTRSRSQV
jgi:hypothetical protein